ARNLRAREYCSVHLLWMG
ncbi:hypothetical protein COY71_04995, partial [Candidatus Micrarchaeota archaeon CG_4_10_14_0_8_um_filter_60_7]